MIGDPSPPPTYSPGPANPSIKRTLPDQLDIIGSHASRYFLRTRCLPWVCGSSCQRVEVGGMCPPGVLWLLTWYGHGARELMPALTDQARRRPSALAPAAAVLL